jgi:hypothetical protein
MALVERLMGELGEPKIPVHDFFAACHEIVVGRLTVAQVKTALALDAAGQIELDALVALAPTGSTALATAQKAQYVESMHSVFILAESRYAGYATPTAVRGKLGI